MKLSSWTPASFATLLSIATTAYANTPINQSVLDNEGLWPFVLASRPRWEFGIPSKGLCPSRTAPCYPDYAVDPSTGAQHPGAEPGVWPNASGGCRNPSADGKAGGVRGQPFPAYYVTSRCGDAEVRVGYWVYFPKDGFTLTGHRHDWEYYIMIWKRDDAGNYYRDRHVLSYHSGRTGTPWGSVKDKVNESLANDSNGDHSKIYVAWSKHAMFDTKKTTVCDTLLQSTLSAYRSNDWHYYSNPEDLVQADISTPIGQRIDEIGRAGGWGSATSWPAVRGAEICSLEATQNGRLMALAESKLDAQIASGTLAVEDWLPFGLMGNAATVEEVSEDEAEEGDTLLTLLLNAVGNVTESSLEKRKTYTPRSCDLS